MSNQSKLVLMAAIAAAVIASPALAQSTTDGSSHHHSARIDRTVPIRHHRVSGPQDRLYNYAPVPEFIRFLGRSRPAHGS